MTFSTYFVFYFSIKKRIENILDKNAFNSSLSFFLFHFLILQKKPIQPLEDVLESEKDDYKFSFNGFLGIETKIFVFLEYFFRKNI